MEIGSKLAVDKCEKKTDESGNSYYKATVMEYVYNPKKKVCGNWELVKYQCYIFDTSIELEPADFSLNVDEKQKKSFKNIANPQKAIFRVMNFSYESHTQYENDGVTIKKDDYGLYKTKPSFKILEIAPNVARYRSKDQTIKELKASIEKLKLSQQKMVQEHKSIANKLRYKIQSLEQQINKLNKDIDKYKKVADDAKILVKNANKELMVARRRNTIIENDLELINNKYYDAKQEVKEIKKMKQKEILNKVKEETFDFGEL